MGEQIKEKINNEVLAGLSEEERKVALSILEEYSTTGESNTHSALLNEDYAETPVDILTFILDERYLGKAWHEATGESKLYPYWENKVKELFPDPYTTIVNNFIISGARGLGKSEVAVTVMAYLIYRVLCLKNPLQYYHLKVTEKISFAFMNITKYLAEDIAISKFQKTIQLSPWFMARGSMTQRNNEPYWIPPEPVEIIIGSQPSHVLGQPIFAAFFDEISFIKTQNIDNQKKLAIDMIDTAIGGMKTRFIHGGHNPTLLILASSKRSEKSFLEEHMKQKVTSENDNLLIVDEAVWNVKPPNTYKKEKFKIALGNKFLQSVVIEDESEVKSYRQRGYKIIEAPIDFKANFMDDIDRSLRDYAGISSSELSKYINGARVHEVVLENRVNPMTSDVIEVGNDLEDLAEYKNFFDLERVPQDLKHRPMFIHLDMSISGDRTGIAGVWIKSKRVTTTEGQERNDLIYTLAFSFGIKAPKGRQISFEKNRNFIYWLKEQGFNIKGISSDTFQSYDTGQALRAKGFNYDVLSVDRVDTDRVNKPYQYLKSTIYEKRIEMYDSKLLIEELIDLERNINTGKVDHSPNGSKDIADALCGAVFNASKHAEEFAFEWGETITNILEASNNSSLSDDEIRRQITVEFEEELKKSRLNKPAEDLHGNPAQGGTSANTGVFVSDDILIW